MKVTKAVLRAAIDNLKKATGNDTFVIESWNGVHSLWVNGGVRVSDWYKTKKELYEFIRGYLLIRSYENS